MTGLLGFLFASGIFALIGTVLRGVIRPISWSVFALATLLAASQQFLNEAQNEVTADALRSNVDSPTVNPSEVNASVAPVPTASVALPVAVEGWRNLPRQLETDVDRVLEAAEPTPSPDITIATEPTPAPASRAIETPVSDTSTSARSTPAPSPIQGFW